MWPSDSEALEKFRDAVRGWPNLRDKKSVHRKIKAGEVALAWITNRADKEKAKEILRCMKEFARKYS